MKLLPAAAGAFAVAVLATTTLSHAAAPDAAAAQLIASSGNAIGAASLASASTMRVDATISAVGLQGTATQWVDLRDGRFAETSNLPPIVQADGYDGRVTWNADGTGLVWNAGGDSERASEIDQAYLAELRAVETECRRRDDNVARHENGRRQELRRAEHYAGRFAGAVRALVRPNVAPAGAQAHFVNGFTTSTLTFSDYRRVNGLNYPYAQHTDSSDGNNGDSKVTQRGVRSARRCRGARPAADEAGGLFDSRRQDVDDRSDYAR